MIIIPVRLPAAGLHAPFACAHCAARSGLSHRATSMRRIAPLCTTAIRYRLQHACFRSSRLFFTTFLPPLSRAVAFTSPAYLHYTRYGSLLPRYRRLPAILAMPAL